MSKHPETRNVFPVAVFVLVLLLSAIAGTLLVNLGSANFIFPEQAPYGIRLTGGAVEGTDKISQSGNVYTLTGDVYETIVVLSDGIVVDGAGYTLQGNGAGTGVFLQERSHVVIKNLKIKNFQYGIKFTWLTYDSPKTPKINKVIGNTITNNTYGVAFHDLSTGSEVSGNYFAGNTYGVVLSSGVVFRNNQFRNNGGAFSESNDVNDIDGSNTVNGRPVYYWVGEHNKTVPSDAGWVALRNCSGITVQGLTLEGNGDGILLYYTNGSTISGNIMADNVNGISLRWSSENVISNNRIRGNSEYGINFEYASNNNVVSKNEITGNLRGGVHAESTVNTTILENHVAENVGDGIFFRSQDSKIIGNNITFNEGSGIKFGGTAFPSQPAMPSNVTLSKGSGIGFGGPSGIIRGNHITKNMQGIWISNGVGNIITLNNIAENYGWGLKLEGSQKDNVIHHNNFINNNVTDGLQVCVAGVFVFPELGKPHKGPPTEAETPKFVAGAANFWDDGKAGNYWSDYETRYPNASEIGNTDVGDTPFFINENNIDRYPLMSPVAIHDVIKELGSSIQQPNQISDSSGMAWSIQPSHVLVAVAAISVVTVSGYLVLKRKKVSI
jgi:parallel beta-helix repeat protein